MLSTDITVLMSSIDFLDQIINPCRKLGGESEHEPRKFLLKIEDELDFDGTGKKFRLNPNHSKTGYYDLNMRQMMLVGMRESKTVRRTVLEKLESLSAAPALPRTYKEALAHLMIQVEENERLTEEVELLSSDLRATKPKAVLMDALMDTQDYLYGLNEAARVLGTSGMVMGATLDDKGSVYVKRRYATTSRQFLKCFIDGEFGRNVLSEGRYLQAKFTFKGLCYAGIVMIRAGVLSLDQITYRPCRDRIEKELKEI